MPQHAGLLMPPTVHMTVTEEQLGQGRLLVLGDLHGCKDELAELLLKANYTHGKDNLILAGDLVDKGPYPIEVHPVRSLPAQHTFSGAGAPLLWYIIR